MKSTLVVAVAACAVQMAFAGPFDKNIKKPYSNLTKEELIAKRAELHEAAQMRTGGMIRKPGVGKGKFVVLSGQSRVPDDVLFGGVKTIGNQIRVMVELQHFDGKVTVSNAEELLKKSGGATCVFVVDDAALPVTVLSAPESRWSIVNVAALAADNANTNFVNARVRKEVVRGFLFASNAGDSRSSGSLMGCVTTPKDLDDHPSSGAPLDVLNRVLRALPKYGMEQWEDHTYYDACTEGWAPAPTNKYQQAVWDKVHALPSDPIVIKSSKAKGK